MISPQEIAPIIDHTLLKATTTENEVRALCSEAKEHGFASVCVNPWFVPLAASELAGSEVRVCTVIGFPLGSTPQQIKAAEAERAVKDGATEVDMVMNIAAFKSGRFDIVESDIAAVVQAVPPETCVKVILETCYLSATEIRRACKTAVNAGADFVKTSTGFASSGASVEAVRLMRASVGSEKGVKASGGIRDYETAAAMAAAGASRIGASASVAIVEGGLGTEHME